jgi:hypothetical protein
MSEYQYYGFLALDKPVAEQQQTELRELSTRAEITAYTFVNEYNVVGEEQVHSGRLDRPGDRL